MPTSPGATAPRARRQIAIALFDRFTALDAVGPHQVLTRLPDTEVIFVSERVRGVTDESGTLTLQARASYAGVSAGIDMALALAARVLGDEGAQRIQLGIEYDPRPPFQAGSPASAKPEIVEFFNARSRFARG